MLLTPSIDQPFDRGFIWFEDERPPIVSPVAHENPMKWMGVRTGETLTVGAFSDGQRRFLDFHRDNVFLERSGGRK